MLSVEEIRNVKFSKSVGGYKQEEVDILLDKIEADYTQYNRSLKEMQAKVDSLKKEIEEYKVSQNSLQNVLLSAQKLADQIIADAKAKSAEIIKEAEGNIAIISAKEKELSNAFEIKAGERKAQLDNEMSELMSKAKSKAASINAGIEDSVARQQMLFDRLKLEVASFKSDVSKAYKEHLAILQQIPDAVPMDPKRAAEAISAILDNEPNAEKYIQKEEVNNEPAPAEAEKASNGFTVDEPVKNEEESD